MEDSNNYDICVIGGGLMGAAVALGLVRSGATVLMADKISSIHRASKANFGLVWSQGKGLGNRDYSRLSEKAVLAFKGFADPIEQESGIDLELRLGAGLVLFIGEQEQSQRSELIQRMHREAEQRGETHPCQILDRNDVQALVGRTALGENVSGGSFSPIDGDVNPLLLLKAMRGIFVQKEGRFLHGCAVKAIKKKSRLYHLETSAGEIRTPKIVMAAGLGNISLAAMLGKKIPLGPQKGQLLVTERVRPFLSLPSSGIRQTGCGSLMIGYTQENTGFEAETTVSAAVYMAKRALQTFPGLAHIRVVRSWAGLRVLPEDGFPIYDEIEENAYLLASHSCVTLAPIHESLLPPWILGGKRPNEIKPYHLERFNV